MDKRVVITGMGAITPIGNNVKDMFDSIVNSKCGIDKITHFDTTNFKVKLAAEVKNYNAEEYLDRRAAKRMDRFTQFGIVAAREAMKDSKITSENTDMKRVGIIVSSGIGGLSTIEEQINNLNTKGPDRVSPMYIPMAISNMAAGNIAIDLGLKGESSSIVTACASGTHSIGEAFRLIRHGYQDAVFCGGCEASITPSGIAGFTTIKALNVTEDKTRASIPFDKSRAGFVMGEGAGVLVLEELEHAKKRGAHIYAEVVGYGASSDAYHITSPAPNGEGGARAMISAIKDAKINSKDITYVNAHGTSTHLNDLYETAAIKTAFEDTQNLYVSSTKGHTGHLLGAAGAVEAIICAKAIEEEIIPPTIGYKEQDEECDLNVVPNKAINKKIEYAMSNSLGFGGHNSSVILKKYED